MLTVLSFFSLAQIVAPVPIPPPSPAPAPSVPPSAPAIETPAIQSPPQVQGSSPLQQAPLVQPSLTQPSVRPPSQVSPVQQQVEIVRAQEVRPLPGQLDNVPVFNSNSPEVIQKDGILLSTFPPDGMQHPSAHLNFPFNGRFDLFAHHIAKGETPDDVRTLFLGVIVHNPGSEPVTIDVLQAVSYLSQEAPFVDLPAYVANPLGTVYAGPGSRTTNDVLRGQRQPHWPAQVVIPPGSSELLLNVPIPLRRLPVATNGSLPPGALIPPPLSSPTAQTAAASVSAVATPNSASPAANPAASTTQSVSASSNTRPFDNRALPINGRSILMHLSSSGPVYMASLAMYAPKVAGGAERVPTLQEWKHLLQTSDLSGPRDRSPTPPDARAFLRFFYGRVSGVSQGSQWTAIATDHPDVNYLSIPQPGNAFSYAISTVDHNTFGTGQIQSAPMLVRYPDTAYRAHGNYGIKYDISLPLHNTTGSTQRVAILFETPVQDEEVEGLRFRNPPDNQVFFRGTVRVRFTDDFGIPQTRYLHLVQRRGQEGEPLLRLTMPSGDHRLVEVQFIYPPDATPPQVLTVETSADSQIVDANQ